MKKEQAHLQVVMEKINRGKGLAVLLLGTLMLACVGAAWSWLQPKAKEASVANPNPTIDQGRSTLRFRPSTGVSSSGQKFAVEDYQRDPGQYLAQVVPGRAFQVQAGRPDLSAIERVSPIQQSVKPLASVELAVRVPPGAPVTFTSVGLGAFPNGRSSISLPADPKGECRTQFTATRGTTGRAIVFAASPQASGQIRFDVVIEGKVPTKPQTINKAGVAPRSGRNGFTVIGKGQGL